MPELLLDEPPCLYRRLNDAEFVKYDPVDRSYAVVSVEDVPVASLIPAGLGARDAKSKSVRLSMRAATSLPPDRFRKLVLLAMIEFQRRAHAKGDAEAARPYLEYFKRLLDGTADPAAIKKALRMSWQAVPYTDGKQHAYPFKAVGDGPDQGRTLYGKQALSAINAQRNRGPDKFPGAPEQGRSHKEHQQYVQASAAKAKEILNRSSNHSAEDLKELTDHLPALPRADLRNVRARLMASFKGARHRAGMVTALMDHVRAALDEEDKAAGLPPAVEMPEPPVPEPAGVGQALTDSDNQDGGTQPPAPDGAAAPQEEVPQEPAPAPAAPAPDAAKKFSDEYDRIEEQARRATGKPAAGSPIAPAPDKTKFAERLRAAHGDAATFDQLAKDIQHHTVSDADVSKAIGEAFGDEAKKAVRRMPPEKRIEWLKANHVGKGTPPQPTPKFAGPESAPVEKGATPDAKPTAPSVTLTDDDMDARVDAAANQSGDGRGPAGGHIDKSAAEMYLSAKMHIDSGEPLDIQNTMRLASKAGRGFMPDDATHAKFNELAATALAALPDDKVREAATYSGLVNVPRRGEPTYDSGLEKTNPALAEFFRKRLGARATGGTPQPAAAVPVSPPTPAPSSPEPAAHNDPSLMHLRQTNTDGLETVAAHEDAGGKGSYEHAAAALKDGSRYTVSAIRAAMPPGTTEAQFAAALEKLADARRIIVNQDADPRRKGFTKHDRVRIGGKIYTQAYSLDASKPVTAAEIAAALGRAAPAGPSDDSPTHVPEPIPEKAGSLFDPEAFQADDRPAAVQSLDTAVGQARTVFPNAHIPKVGKKSRANSTDEPQLGDYLDSLAHLDDHIADQSGNHDGGYFAPLAEHYGAAIAALNDPDSRDPIGDAESSVEEMKPLDNNRRLTVARLRREGRGEEAAFYATHGAAAARHAQAAVAQQIEEFKRANPDKVPKTPPQTVTELEQRLREEFAASPDPTDAHEAWAKATDDVPREVRRQFMDKHGLNKSPSARGHYSTIREAFDKFGPKGEVGEAGGDESPSEPPTESAAEGESSTPEPWKLTSDEWAKADGGKFAEARKNTHATHVIGAAQRGLDIPEAVRNEYAEPLARVAEEKERAKKEAEEADRIEREKDELREAKRKEHEAKTARTKANAETISHHFTDRLKEELKAAGFKGDVLRKVKYRLGGAILPDDVPAEAQAVRTKLLEAYTAAMKEIGGPSAESGVVAEVLAKLDPPKEEEKAKGARKKKADAPEVFGTPESDAERELHAMHAAGEYSFSDVGKQLIAITGRDGVDGLRKVAERMGVKGVKTKPAKDVARAIHAKLDARRDEVMASGGVDSSLPPADNQTAAISTGNADVARQDAGRPAAGTGGPVAGRDDGRGDSGVPDGTRTEPARPRIVTAREQFTLSGNPELVPQSLREHLTPAQQQGASLAIDAMTKHGGFLLADGTGVGKTRQQLAVGKHFLGAGKKVVIVSPAEVIKPDWTKGTMSGSFAHDSAAMGVPTKLTKGDAPLSPGVVHLTTYNELAKLKSQIDGNTVVLFDESHSMKNRESARYKHGKDISDKAAAVMFATATPGDKPLHIAHLARAGVFGNLGSTKTFEKLGMRLVDQHIGRGEYRKVWQVDPKVGYRESLRRMSGLFDQMTKDGLMVKRELSMHGVDVGMNHANLTPNQHDEIDKVFNDVLEKTDGNKAVALMAARLHQEPMKVPHTVDIVRKELAEGRSPVVFLGRVNDIGGDDADDDEEDTDEAKKALAETGHSSEGTAKLLRAALIAAGVPEDDIGELHGGATKTAAQKKKAMENFQANKKKVMIATVQSGGTGINLDDTTGTRPRTVVIMTPPFTANDMAQAIGRVHRLNTKSNSRVRGVLADTEIDRWNAELLNHKFRTLGAIAGGEAMAGAGAARPANAPEVPADDVQPFDWGESLHPRPKVYLNTPFAHNDLIGQFGGKRTKVGGDWTTEFPDEASKAKYLAHVAPKPAAPSGGSGKFKRVATSNGPRSVETMTPSKKYWDRVHKSRPSYLSVRKNQNGDWELSVWGKDDAEVEKNLADLKRLME